MRRTKKTYKVVVDVDNTQGAIKSIQQQLREDVKKDFLSGLLPDGSVPRGLISVLASKYGYSGTWITKILKNQGVTTSKKVSNADTI